MNRIEWPAFLEGDGPVWQMAEAVADIFTEIVVAPAFEPGALEVLTRKKNVRLLRLPAGALAFGDVEIRPISGGLLMQARDRITAVVAPSADDAPSMDDAPPAGHGDAPSDWALVAGPPAPADMLADLSFAWRAVRLSWRFMARPPPRCIPGVSRNRICP